MIALRRAQYPGLHKIATDMAVPDDSLGWVYERYQSLLGGEGLDFAVFGHVGDNHFHVNILPRDERELARAMACYALLAREIVARGGAVAAEHGIGRIKKCFLPLQYSRGDARRHAGDQALGGSRVAIQPRNPDRPVARSGFDAGRARMVRQPALVRGYRFSRGSEVAPRAVRSLRSAHATYRPRPGVRRPDPG